MTNPGHREHWELPPFLARSRLRERQAWLRDGERCEPGGGAFVASYV